MSREGKLREGSGKKDERGRRDTAVRGSITLIFHFVAIRKRCKREKKRVGGHKKNGLTQC